MDKSIKQQIAGGTRDRNLYIVSLYNKSQEVSGADIVQILAERGIKLTRQRVLQIVKRYNEQHEVKPNITIIEGLKHDGDTTWTATAKAVDDYFSREKNNEQKKEKNDYENHKETT